jgi:hypothetical protein
VVVFVYIRLLLGILVDKLYPVVYYFQSYPQDPYVTYLHARYVNIKIFPILKKLAIKITSLIIEPTIKRKIISKIITVLITAIIIYVCRNNFRTLFLENVFSFVPILIIVSIFTILDEIVKFIISNLIYCIYDILFPITHVMSSSLQGGSNLDQEGSNTNQAPNLGASGNGNEDRNEDAPPIPQQNQSDDSGLESELEPEQEQEPESESSSDESLGASVPGIRASDNNLPPIPMPDISSEVSAFRNAYMQSHEAALRSIRSSELTQEQED